jgi:hypothetical protein
VLALEVGFSRYRVGNMDLNSQGNLGNGPAGQPFERAIRRVPLAATLGPAGLRGLPPLDNEMRAPPRLGASRIAPWKHRDIAEKPHFAARGGIMRGSAFAS